MYSYYSEVNKIDEQTTDQLDASELTDGDRADELAFYLRELAAAGWDDVRLMPVTDDGKKPLIRARGKLLDKSTTATTENGETYHPLTETARRLLVTGPEAVEAIRDGARGFALYAGHPETGTVGLCFTDHDDLDRWPPEDVSASLTVMTGSGRFHKAFANFGVKNANGKGDLRGAGEVRAKNWYCVTPGSIHPDGGVYHVVETGIGGLFPDDLPEELRPAGGSSGGEITETGETPDPDPDTVATAEALLRDFQNDSRTTGRAFHEVMDLVNGKYAEHGHVTDGTACRHRAELAAFSRLYGVFDRYGGEDDDTEQLATAYLSHGCLENPYTEDGQPRKWPNLGATYRKNTAQHAIETFDPDVFDLWRKKREDGARRWTGEYNEDSEHRVLQSIAVLADPDDPEHYPTRADVVAEANDWDDGHLDDESYRYILSTLVNDRGQVKTAKVGHNDWRYYLSFEPDPPGAEVVRYRGDEYEPGGD